MEVRRALPLLLVLMLGFALRVYRLEGHDIWGDEAWSITVAGWPLARVVSAEAETNPPLYHVLLFGVVRLAGWTPFAVRFLSVWSGTLTVALLYRLGKEVAGRWAGMGTSFVGALSPFLVYYAQEARMYGVALAGATASLLTFVLLYKEQLAGRRPSFFLWLLYGASSLAAVYSHYYALAVLLAELAFATGMAIGRRRALHLKAWLVAWGTMALLFAPWPFVHARFLEGKAGSRFGEWTVAKLGEIARRTLLAYGVGTTMPSGGRWYGWAMVALAAWGAIWLAWRARKRSEAILLLLVLVWGLVFAWAVNPIMPFFWERYLLVCAPAFLVLVAVGIGGLGDLARPAAAAAVLLVLTSSTISLRHYYFDPAYAKGGYGHLMADLSSRAQPDDLILLNNPLQKSLYDYYGPKDMRSVILDRDALLDEERTDRLLTKLTDGYRRVWLVESGDAREYDPRHRARAWLGQHGSRSFHRTYTGCSVALFVLAAADEAQHPLAVNLGNVVMLSGYSLGSTVVHPGEELLLTLYWQATRPVTRSYTVFTHLLDAQSHVQAQVDGLPVGGTRPTNTWAVGEVIRDNYAILVPVDTAPGSYELEVGMYLWPAMTRLPVIGADGRPEGDRVLLGTVQVVNRSGCGTSRRVTLSSVAWTRWRRVSPWLSFRGGRGRIRPSFPDP